MAVWIGLLQTKLLMLSIDLNSCLLMYRWNMIMPISSIVKATKMGTIVEVEPASVFMRLSIKCMISLLAKKTQLAHSASFFLRENLQPQ